jgi:hypothetical protein
VGRGDDHHDDADVDHGAEHLEPAHERGYRSRTGRSRLWDEPLPEHGGQLVVVLGPHLRLPGHLMLPPPHPRR